MLSSPMVRSGEEVPFLAAALAALETHDGENGAPCANPSASAGRSLPVKNSADQIFAIACIRMGSALSSHDFGYTPVFYRKELFANGHPRYKSPQFKQPTPEATDPFQV
jgi:hypothetical protein